MRDDVKAAFIKLIDNLKSKTKLLNLLLEKEKAASDLIKNRNDAEDDILEIIDFETTLISEINVEDYHISRIRDDVISKYRFDFNKIFKKNYTTTVPEILNYKKEIQLHEQILEEIICIKNQNNLKLTAYHQDLKIQISELERMAKIKIIYPKDLRSS